MRTHDDIPQPVIQGCLESLFRVAKGIEHHASAMDRNLELTGTQFWALWELGLAGPLALKDLASRLRLDSSTVVGVVDRMAAKGLVSRNPDPQDRRRISLTLTLKGKDLLVVAHRAIERPLQDGLSALGPTRLSSLREILRVLETRLWQA